MPVRFIKGGNAFVHGKLLQVISSLMKLKMVWILLSEKLLRGMKWFHVHATVWVDVNVERLNVQGEKSIPLVWCG